jgi:hypothetical protein
VNRSMTCRETQDDVETAAVRQLRDKAGACLRQCPVGIRHRGGVSADWALVRNVGTCVPMRREKLKVEEPARARVPMRGAGTEVLVVGQKAL